MKFDMKKKLLAQFIFNGLMPLLVMGFLAHHLANQFLYEGALSKLQTSQELKSNSIKRYFKTIRHQIQSFSHDDMIIDATVEFKDNFFSVIEDQELDDTTIPDMRNALEKYYTGPFSQEFENQNGVQPNTASMLSQMDDLSILWQYRYIQDNQNPLGSKHELYKANDNSEYSETHARVHPFVKEFLENFGFYDIFIIDSQSGHIIYSVFKELDYATSLKTGPYSTTNFARVFNDAAKAKDTNYVQLVDFEQYPPSYQAPASFIAAPIIKNGKNIAVVVFQMPIDGINDIMGDRAGLGETGETFLVGPDKLLRSDSALSPEKHSVISSFRHKETGKVDTEDVSKAIGGETGQSLSKNYLNDEVVSIYAPVDLVGLRWALLAQQHTSEAFGAANQLGQYMIYIALISLFFIIIAGLYVGRSIANPIVEIASELSGSSQQVSDAAKNMAQSSHHLSDLATEQSAAIEETAASVEEISAMVKNNLQQAQDSSDLSDHIQEVAQKGNSSMEKLVQSMNEITESNKRIQDLVQIIGEIGEKTEVIDEIVFQTKLLSFNASVEAERAGEHGRGFSVVAQEVGNLAQMSGKAALEISSMVQKSIRDTEEITTESKKKVEQGNVIVKETAQFLMDIASDAGRMSDQSSRIVTASREQSDGISQVNDAMNQLDQATQQNSATAETSADGAKSLEDQADSLLSNIERLMSIIYNRKIEATQIVAETETKPKPQRASKRSDTAPQKKSKIKEIGHSLSNSSSSDDSWKNL